MVDSFVKCSVITPEDHIGDVYAELVRIGAALDGHFPHGTSTIIAYARVPSKCYPAFVEWLRKTLKNEGQVHLEPPTYPANA
jgi:translation elongation factor EF-G